MLNLFLHFASKL